MYDDWRGRLYPEHEPKRRWLELYASHFDTVEVNATFYRLPRRETVQAWANHTPAGFTFAVKASRYLTHVKRLRDIGEGIARFYDPLEPLVQSRRLGPILWQLPETFHRDDAVLGEWLELLAPGMHTIEFRHASWFAPEVMSALRARGVALTIGDDPKRPFQTHEATTTWRYVRFHYGTRGRDGNYSAREIDRWGSLIEHWLRTTDVFAYFNNDWRGFAPANARSLRRRLDADA
jgi:uncharacterized protein YecE (DUF72 family)